MKREPHVCAACRTVLDWFAPLDGTPGWWQHTQASTPDDGHEAVPVPRREMTDVRTRCDYCGQPDPVVMFVLADRMKLLALADDNTVMGGSTDDDGLWAACADCVPIVESGSAAKLTAHVARRMAAALGRQPAREVLYRMYVTHLTIPRLRVELNDEEE